MAVSSVFRVCCIYELKNDGSNYRYDFHSFALACIDKHNGYVIRNGIFVGADDSFFEKIIMEATPSSKTKMIINDPRFVTSHYACLPLAFDFNDDNIIEQLREDLWPLKNMSLSWEGAFYPKEFKIQVSPKIKVDADNGIKLSERELIEILSLESFSNVLDNDRNIQSNVEKEEDSDKKSDVEVDVQTDIDVNEIIAQMKQKFVGQDEVIESIVANIYANQRMIDTGDVDLISVQKTSILLDGPTGTGKTAIIKEVASQLSLPIVIVNASSFSATGYVGDSLSDILFDLYKKSNSDLELAQRGIICIDEIDKLGGMSKDKELSMRRAVQQELLTFISGSKVVVRDLKKEFDTSNITFIGMGAFTQIRDRKIEEKRHASKPLIGFNTFLGNNTDDDQTYIMTEQDYIDYGLERELVGRFSLLTSTRTYSVEDFKNILLNSSLSPLKSFILFANSFGVEVVSYGDDFIQLVSEKAYDAGFGVRGLHKIFSDLKNSMLLDIINNKTNKIELTVDMLKKLEEKKVKKY